MPSVPVKYIRLHLTLLLLPVIVGVIGLITINGREVIGIFALDKLAWLVGAFVLALGFIIQKFSARYLLGIVIIVNTSRYTHLQQYLRLLVG